MPGYEVRDAGKIFHHHLVGAFHDEASFRDLQPMRAQLYPLEKLNGAPQYGSRNTDWGRWPQRVDQSIDYHTDSYCVQALKERDADKPLFLACGIFKPHSPFFAPGKYHEPFGEIEGPLRKPDDWRDLPSGASELLKDKKWFWRGMMEVEKTRKGAYHDFIRTYAACATLADDQIGRVLDALDNSPRRDRTIVVLRSDHGFHLGEKDHIEKFALWEKATHIPFIVVAAGITRPGSRCDRPVDMSVLYPTLLELVGLPDGPQRDGQRIVPLLRNPDRDWEPPAFMTYQRGNHAVRSQRWRYIRYADGSEELYDHRTDPHEWENVAGNADFARTKEQLKKWLPRKEAKPALGKAAYEFNPARYEWTRRGD